MALCTTKKCFPRYPCRGNRVDLRCLMPSRLLPTTDVAFWRKRYRLRSRWARNAPLDYAFKPTEACAIGHFVEMLCTTGSQVSCSLAMKANVSSGVMARV